ncbi:MAG: ABC transporter ATP-binding protein [Candidatus Rokubacteria bacterium]|nr:ABC transporter ATP-binding protein [Candidatus Rokubacteria bacterium]
MLEVTGLRVAYDGVEVLHGIDLRVGSNEIVALLGANGAGKSTTLKGLAGLGQPTAGRVRFDGRDLLGLPTEAIARLGVSLVPEGRRIFPGLSVFGNLEVATTPWAGWRTSLESDLDRVFTLFPQLRPRLRQRGWSLSGGEQQMLAIARALMSRPKLLLLDEPSLGLAPRVVRTVFRAIQEINRRGTPILLVEQNSTAALRIAHRGYVMEHGRIVLEDDAGRLLAASRVKEAYLGA